MKRLAFVFALIVAGLTVSNSAYAWFFFFIPGSATRAVADAFTGAKGNICVKEGTQAGQILTSGNGNTAKVLSLSGTSSICRNPALPIRAELEFTYNFSSKAGIDLSDDFQPGTITDLERFNGWLLKATSKSTRNHGIQISATTKKANLDIETMANNMERTILNNQKLKDVASARMEKRTINGMPAVRFEISGTLSGIFGQRITYQYTIMEGDNEVVVVDVYAPVEYMESNRQELQKVAERVSGLRSADRVASPPVVALPIQPAITIQTPTTPPAVSVGDQPTGSPALPVSPATTAPPNESVSVTTPSNSLLSNTEISANKLRELNKLYKEGILNQQEYEAKKQEVLKGM